MTSLGNPPDPTLVDDNDDPAFPAYNEETHYIYTYQLHGRTVDVVFDRQLGLGKDRMQHVSEIVVTDWLDWWTVFQGFPYPSYSVVFGVKEISGNAAASGFDLDYAHWQNDMFGCQSLAHEIFHAWNGNAFAGDEALRWFIEGFTQYYGYRACSRGDCLSLMSETLDYYHRERAAERDMSVLEAGVHLPGTERQFFYYAKGSLVAYLLDRVLQQEHDLTLDDYMRAVYQRYGIHSLTLTNEGLLQVLNDLTGRGYSGFFADYVYGTEPLPLETADLVCRPLDR